MACASSAQQRFYLQEQRTRTAEVARMYNCPHGAVQLLACLASDRRHAARRRCAASPQPSTRWSSGTEVFRTALFSCTQSSAAQLWQRMLTMDDWRAGERLLVATS